MVTLLAIATAFCLASAADASTLGTLLGIGPTFTSAEWFNRAASVPMRDGSPCTYDKNGMPLSPFCPGNKYNCVVKSVPNPEVQVFNGRCNSRYRAGSFCKFTKIPYAVGAKGITGNPLCQHCDCLSIRSIPGRNKAACICNALPTCFVDYDGKPRGKFRCPPRQKMCIITRPGGGGLDKQRRPIDLGQCVYSGIAGLCATGGATWGPKFYMKGVNGVPKANNRCITCTCSANGSLSHCKKVRGCKRP